MRKNLMASSDYIHLIWLNTISVSVCLFGIKSTANAILIPFCWQQQRKQSFIYFAGIYRFKYYTATNCVQFDIIYVTRAFTEKLTTINESKMTTIEATIDMGPGTHAVPLSLFRDNRLRVCNAIKNISNISDDKTFVLLQGGDSLNLYNTDVEYIFRQVSHTITLTYTYMVFQNEMCLSLSVKLIRKLHQNL